MPQAAGRSITLVASNRPPSGRGGDLEEAWIEPVTGIEHFCQQLGEQLVGDQLTGNADALVVTHEMRLDRRVDRLAVRFEHRPQVGAGRSLAVGPGDMEHRRQPRLRIAEPREQRADRLQPEPALRQREFA
jgi:hypothetical protein